MKNFIILIPPSEGKNTGGNSIPVKPSKEVKEMIKTLHSCKDDPAKLYGVKGAALEKAILVNKNVLKSKTLPAIQRYSGVVYKALGYESLGSKAKIYADKHIGIISALFGLVHCQDLIPDYKLKIDKLGAAGFWKPHIAKQLQGSFVIDLLPQAHKNAVSYDEGIEVEFVIVKDGKKKPAGHMGKHIKGRFVRWLCENQIKDVKDFKKFSEEGFKWDGKCFLRKE